MTKKQKNTEAKSPKSKQEVGKVAEWYSSIGSLSGATCIPVAEIKLAKKKGCDAFDSSGRVHLLRLLRWLFSQKEYADVNWANRLKEFQAKREEAEFEKLIGNLISLEVLKPALIGLGKVVVQRMLIIPDRVAQKYAATNDHATIHEDLLKEIRMALKVVSESGVKQLIKEANGK